MQPKHWTAFLVLGAVWSTSFLWIKIALQEVGPFTLVGLRVLFGALATGAVVLYTRTQWPRSRKTWANLFLLGITSISIPFFLISWGQLSIDSTVASILNATVPLFTFVIAHIFTSDDKMSLEKIIGLVLGFVGVITLLSKDFDGSSQNSIVGQGAVLLAAIFYAGSSVYARLTTQHISGIMRGTAPLIGAALVMWLITPIMESPITLPVSPLPWIGVLWLGIFGSGLAMILWYYLLHEIGPTRATMVTYIFPVGGVILGVLFLNEALTWQLIAGTILIISSIAVVNWKKGKSNG